VPVIVTTTYTASVSGTTAVAVRCEECGEKYYYQLSRVAYGQASAMYGIGREEAKRQATRNAKRRLRRALEEDIDPVPCPECGWYQEKMLPLLRQGRLRWLTHVAGGCLVGGIVLFVSLMFFMWAAHEKKVPDPPDWVAWAWVGLAGLVLLAAPVLVVSRIVLNRLYDGNKALKKRERILRGQERAITREEADELLKRQDD
jgi:hypothetical protein